MNLNAPIPGAAFDVDAPPTPPRVLEFRPQTRRRLVIVGNGMAGYKLCEQLVARGAARFYEIVVFGEEPRPAYDRVHLTEALEGRSVEDLTLAPRGWYQEHDIQLHTNHRVVAIDRAKREVTTDGAAVCSYDKLVFATGSTPYVPPIDGVHLPGVYVYRTMDDLASIRRRSRRAGSAAVVGGGLLGLEAARALDRLGVECHIIEYAPHVLVAQLDQTAGRMAQAQIEELGLHVRSNARLEAIHDRGEGLVLEFAGDHEPALRVDMVVVAAGIRPRIDLARASGLTTGEIGGIVVNDHLQTSDPDIYAIGECAAHRGVTYGLVAPAYRMAETLAGALMGEEVAFRGADPSTRLKLLGLDVAVIGDYKQPGRIVTWTGEGAHRSIVLRRDRLIGASALGDWPEVRRMQDAVGRSQRVWPWQIARFRRQGRLWRDRRLQVVDWPEAATVCNCLNLSCGTLKSAIAGGCATPEALARQTGASTLCGSCRPLLAALTGADATPGPAPGRRVLAGASVAAVLAILAAVFFAPLPYPETVQNALSYDVLWREPVWRQTTGFTLLGVSLAGLLMSLRKRWRRFRWGEFSHWRALHAVAGVTGLAVLAAHTGMRLGDNLNSVLMAVFVGTNLLGAAAGGVVGAGSGSPGAAAAGRWLTRVHIAFVWPLPVLVAFHIWSAYFF